MKVLYKWLREFVDTDLSPEEIAEGLTMAGMEVATVQRVGSPSTAIKVGLIKEIRAHSNLNRLIVCRVHVGDGDLEIVTGDLSLKVGDLAAVALPGAELPRKRRIEVVDFKGERSQGMLCALTEILLGEPHRENEGVLVLEPSPATRPGTDLAEALGWDDYLLELELTPNYVHCLSLVGVAREVASLDSKDLTHTGEVLWYTWRTPDEKRAIGSRRRRTGERRVSDTRQVRVVIEDPHLCGRYSARVIDGVKTTPSDPLVQWRLVMVDQRPINNIVDATNYAMIETGQPMHAFDYDLIRENTIVVRTARRNESIETLDGVKRDLDEGMLVISDGRRGDRPVAIAGVMGGSETEISDSTTTVLLESAFFTPESVGATSRRLGLKSEASVRFEKGVDPLGTARAIERFEEVLKRTNGYSDALPLVDECPVPFKPITIDISSSYINRLLGTRLSPRQIKQYLCGLGFEVTEKKGRTRGSGGPDEGPAAAGLILEVLVPTRRGDVKREVDLVEEVGRAAGLDRIPATLPTGFITVGDKPTLRRLVDRMRNLAAAGGLDEVVTYSFIGDKTFDALRLDPSHPMRRAVPISNPIREDRNVMRTSLLPGLLETLSYNASRQVEDMGVFEVGRIFVPLSLPVTDLPEERTFIGVAGMGYVSPRAWNMPRLAYDFFYMKGIVERILSDVGIREDAMKLEPSEYPFLHPTRQAAVLLDVRAGERIRSNGEGRADVDGEEEWVEIGYLGEVHPEVVEAYRLSSPATACEIDLNKILPYLDPVPKFVPVPRYPAVKRDLALVVREGVSAGTVLRSIKCVGGDLLEDVRLFDVYTGDPIPEGEKSLAFSLTYRAPDRTLTDQEVDEIQQRIEDALAERIGAKKRL